jgi:hypothetical protein
MHFLWKVVIIQGVWVRLYRHQHNNLNLSEDKKNVQ